MASDWLSRVVLPDLYPRREDPFRPSAAIVPGNVPPASMLSENELISGDIYQSWLTEPGARPIVYQRAVNFNVTADVQPVPLANMAFQCDLIVLDVLSTAANSIFFGYSSSINTTTGQEVRAGLPVAFGPDNSREQWEIQRLLEAIAAMMAAQMGLNPLPKYRAPRVVLNANDVYVVAAAPTNVRVMLFLVPELQ